MKFVLLLFVFMILQDGNAFLDNNVYYTGGIMFPKDQSYLTITVSSRCECRKLCIEDQRCQNYCWKSYAEHASCRLSDLNVQNLTNISSINSGSGMKMPYNGFLGADNFLYFPTSKLMNFTEAKHQCESHNGFHVGVYKTEIQYNTLLQFYNMYKSAIWVDMTPLANSPNAYAVWADGTPFNDTEVSSMNLTRIKSDDNLTVTGLSKFRFDGTLFNDRPESTGSYIALCQLDLATI